MAGNKFLDFLNSLPKRGDVTPEELAARRQGYADLFQDGLLARNRDEMPASVNAVQASQDFIPGIGDALALGEAYDAASRGELMAAGLLGTGAAIGLVPGAGDMLARPIMAAGRKAADFADRIELDPTAFGTVGGNVRLRPAGEAPQGIPVMQGRSKKGLTEFFNPNGVSWGTNSRETAEQFAGRNEVYWPNRTPPERAVEFSGDVYDLNFDLKNPLDVDISQTLWSADKEMALVAEAKATGHDGLRISHPSGKIDYVAFDPSQVKPAGLLSDAAPSLPAPRNEAEAMAKQVLEMRAAGNAGDVTEDMMAAADDTYMFNNTPLDMSAEGRMGRAGDLTRDYFHGSNADIGGFDRSTRGTFLSSNPDVSDSYVNRDGGQIYPVAVRGGEGFPVVDGGGALFNRIPESGLPDEFEYMKYDNNGRPFNTDFVVQASAQDGSPGVVFDSIIDRGPNIKTYLGETAEEALARASRASLPSDVTNVIFPHNIRSIFARNDPEFKHLRNLSAGVGGVGLLNAMMEEEQRQKQGLLQ